MLNIGTEACNPNETNQRLDNGVATSSDAWWEDWQDVGRDISEYMVRIKGSATSIDLFEGWWTIARNKVSTAVSRSPKGKQFDAAVRRYEYPLSQSSLSSKSPV